MNQRGMLFLQALVLGGLVLAGSAQAVEQQRGGDVRKPVVDRIVVGLEEFQLIAYDKKDRVIFHFPITHGADTGPTPTGTFRITSRLKHPWYTPDDEETERPGDPENPLGSRWLGINKPSYGLHGTNEPNVIRARDSEGCVRLRNRDIEKLYRHVPRGTKVFIKERLNLDSEKTRRVQHDPESEDAKQES